MKPIRKILSKKNSKLFSATLGVILFLFFFQNCNSAKFNSSITEFASTTTNGTLSLPTDLTQPTHESNFINQQFSGRVSNFSNAVDPSLCSIIGSPLLPLVTHYPRLGDHDFASYNAPAIHFQPLYDFQKFGLPKPGNYIANSFSTGASTTNSALENLLKKLCARGIYKVKFLQGANQINRNGDLAAIVENNVAYFQVLHGLVYKKNLFTVIVPPNVTLGSANQKPTLFNGFYDLNQNLVDLEAKSMFEILSSAYTEKSQSAFGILWNGGGAIGSRTLDSPAFQELDEFLKIYLADLGAADNKLVTFGISRGGATAFNVAAHPSVTMKAAFMYSENPPYRIRDVANLTGPTVPALLTAPDWSVGFHNSWYKSFRHPAGIPGREAFVGLNGADAHIMALTGTTSDAQLDSTFNLMTPSKISKLKAAQTQIILEVGSHDFICPSVDQFKWYQDAIQAGLDVEVRRNYFAGHTGDYNARDARLLSAINKLLDGAYNSSNVRFVQKGLVKSYLSQPDGRFTDFNVTDSPITLEFPRYMVSEAPSHILVTGNPNTTIYVLFEKNKEHLVETITLDNQGLGKHLLNDSKYPVGDYISKGVFVADSNKIPKFKLVTISTSKEPRGIVMTSLVGQEIPTDINAAATLLRAFRGDNNELSYFNSNVTNGTNYGLLQMGAPQPITDAESNTLNKVLNFKKPTCTYQITGANPLPVGQSLTEQVSCTDLPSGAVVKMLGTKDGVSQINSVLNLVNNQFSKITLNDGSPAVAGVYLRNVVITSSTGQTLFTSSSVSHTLTAIVVPSASCTYQLIGTNPLPVGQSVNEKIICSNLPVGASVRLIGTKDGTPQIDTTVTLTAGQYNAIITNDGASLAGVYVRYVKVLSSTGLTLFTSSSSSHTLTRTPTAVPTCTYQIVGANPLPVGETVSEQIACSNLPTGAVVKLIGTKDGAPQINATVNLENNQFSALITNDGAALAGVYVRRVEIISSSGQNLFTSANITQTLQQAVVQSPTCFYQITGNNPLPVGQTVSETIGCSNLPAGAVVKIIGTKDGAPQINTALVLTGGQFSSNTVNDGSLAMAGTYLRRVEIISSTGVNLYTTQNISFTVLAAPPSCTYSVTGPNPLGLYQTITENITCRNIPTGGVVNLIGTKDFVPQIDTVIVLTNGQFTANFTNNGILGTAGVYERRVELRSSAGSLLHTTPSLSVTVLGIDP